MDVVARPAPSPRRTKRRGRHPDKALSAAFVRSAPPGRHADGNGLYLFVQPTGTRSWVQRLVIRGRRRELGLGAATLVPLAKAREQALANRMLARSGGDPLSEKRRVQGVPTFAEAAQRVLNQKRGGWRGRWHAQNWWRSMQRYVFPRVGSRPVSEVNTADVLEILSPIWHVKAATAKEVRQRIRSVLEWAIALDLRNDNPCDRVVPVLGPQNDIVTHRQALPHKDVAAALTREGVTDNPNRHDRGRGGPVARVRHSAPGTRPPPRDAPTPSPARRGTTPDTPGSPRPVP